MIPAHVEKIQSRGHWRVIVRPSSFEAIRVKNILHLKHILESCAVVLRGWDFPHIDHKSEPDVGKDRMSQEIDWEMYVEYWSFYQSGQFLHLDGFKEDWIEQVQQLSMSETWEPGQRFEVVNAVFRFTEIYEFAARLATTEAGDNTMNIAIGLHGLKGRRLWVSEAKRAGFDMRHVTAMPEFIFEQEYSAAELAAEARSLALEPATELFRRFNWDPPMPVLQSMQDELRR